MVNSIWEMKITKIIIEQSVFFIKNSINRSAGLYGCTLGLGKGVEMRINIRFSSRSRIQVAKHLSFAIPNYRSQYNHSRTQVIDHEVIGIRCFLFSCYYTFSSSVVQCSGTPCLVLYYYIYSILWVLMEIPNETTILKLII